MRGKGLLLVVVVVVLLMVGGGGVAVVVSSRKRFMDAVGGEVERQLRAQGVEAGAASKAGRIVAAQAALESGYGSTRAYREGWNFGNVSKGSWTGPTIGGGDKEYGPDGKVKAITQQWRKYGSLAEAVKDFLALLSWSRYQPARTALLAGDTAGYTAQLRAGGYYTAPLAEYQAGIRSALGVLS